jgi:transcriptional regulator with XRE-family HTH domain
MTKKRVYSKYTEEALLLLGKEIRLNRKKHNWNESDLAERAGIARATLQKIESGNPGCAIGLFFEIAVLVGIKLFDSEEATLRRHLAQADEKLTLLPRKVRHKTMLPDDDF